MFDAEFLEKFWSKVQKGENEDDCWEWPGPFRKGGYGQIWNGPTLLSTHRVSYEIHFGPIPPGLVLLHSCDNPKCCNPKHLTAGTQERNLQDMSRKGRGRQEKREYNKESIW